MSRREMAYKYVLGAGVEIYAVMVVSGWLIVFKVLMYGILGKKASAFFTKTGLNFCTR